MIGVFPFIGILVAFFSPARTERTTVTNKTSCLTPHRLITDRAEADLMRFGLREQVSRYATGLFNCPGDGIRARKHINAVVLLPGHEGRKTADAL